MLNLTVNLTQMYSHDGDTESDVCLEIWSVLLEWYLSGTPDRSGLPCLNPILWPLFVI